MWVFIKLIYIYMANKNSDEQNQFLDELRESGKTNMFGAGRFLQDEFGIDRTEAREVLLEWIKNFKD